MKLGGAFDSHVSYMGIIMHGIVCAMIYNERIIIRRINNEEIVIQELNGKHGQ